MLLKEHAVMAALTTAIFYFDFGIFSLLIFASSVLIDLDHILIYAWRFKKFDVKATYDYFKEVTDGSSFYPVFHMIEFAAILLVIGFYFLPFILIFLGVFSHIALDFCEEKLMRPTGRNFSTYTFWKKFF